MFGTFYTSYSGVVSNSTALSVTSNNLSNINTVGFKRSNAGFHQLLTNLATRSGNGNPLQFGLGSRTAAISPVFTQGSLQETGRSTNIALQGNGFFQLSQNNNLFYSRAGNFGLDPAGRLVAPNGAAVQGYTERDEDGNIVTGGAVGDIVIDFEGASAPKATELVRYITNLTADAPPGEVVASELVIYDANGEDHKLTLRFTNTESPGQWNYEFDVQGGSAPGGTGTVTFNSDGTLATLDGQDVSVPGFQNRTIDLTGFVNGAPDMSVTWDLVQPPRVAGDPNDTLITNYNAEGISSTVFQDGHGSGELESVNFTQDGVLQGYYSNGDTVQLAQVAIAFFGNNQGLKQAGNGFYSATGASGEATLNANSGTRVLGGTLEVSNVDIANEFVDLIFHQRAYQGNTRSINTTNQVVQEILGLKR